MHGALGTGSLAFLEPAFLQAASRILDKLGAIRAQLAPAVPAAAVQGDHRTNRLLFANNATTWIRHQRTRVTFELTHLS